jgi:pectate lyase
MRFKTIFVAVLIIFIMFSMISTSTYIPNLGTKTVYAASTGGYADVTGSLDTAVTVTNLTELQNAFNQGKHHIIISGNIYGGSKPYTLTFASKSWDNVTIEGAPGGEAVLQNIQLKFSGEQLPAGQYINNILIKNITFYGKISDLQNLSGADIQPGGIGTNYLGVSFRRVTNAWVDHCTIYNTSDDLMSISLGSDYVTVSYSHFYFTDTWLNMNPNPLWSWISGNWQDLASERLAMVIGANKTDSYTYGGNRLHITMHHNRFGPNMKGRPLLRGYVHLYNNYFDNSTAPSGMNAMGSSQTQYNAIQIGSGSVVYSENNYFYKTNQSNQIGLDSSGDAYSFYERNNYYNSVTGTKATGASFPSSSPFPYSYTLDAASNVANIVQANAGPK